MLESLPLELLEAICVAPATAIERHHVRSLLSATCKTFNCIIPVPNLSYSKTRRAIVWLTNGCSMETVGNIENIAELAARCGRLDILATYLELHPTTSICTTAATYGQLSSLRYAHENGAPWDINTCVAAAKNGHLNCLRYAHENGCKWNHVVTDAAATNGHLHCLQYAHQHGCKWRSIYTDTTNICYRAAQHGHLDCLRYCHENRCMLVESSYAAARYGHLDCLRYIFENNGAYDEHTLYIAARHGHLDCLKYAHEHGTFSRRFYFSMNIHPRCMAYARSNDWI